MYLASLADVRSNKHQYDACGFASRGGACAVFGGAAWLSSLARASPAAVFHEYDS